MRDPVDNSISTALLEVKHFCVANANQVRKLAADGDPSVSAATLLCS
jgi:hypothetical protein